MRIILANIIYPTPMHSDVVGGAEISTRKLAEAFASIGHDVLVLCSHNRGNDLYDEVVNNVRIVSAPIRNYYWPFDGVERSFIKKIAWHLIDNTPIEPTQFSKIISEFEADVAITSNLIGLTWGIWRRLNRSGVPIIHVPRDYYLLCGRSSMYRDGATCKSICFECKVATFGRRSQAKMVSGVVGISDAILRIHKRFGVFPNAKVMAVIPNISEPIEFKGIQRKRGKSLRFGYIGRLAAEKGVGSLAAAFGGLTSDAELIIAGAADPAMRVFLTSEAQGKVIQFLGFVNPEEFYKSVDVVVVPSIWEEPLSRAAIQAQSYGLPVIGTSRGGVAEAVGNTGAGWIYDPARESALVELMDMLCANPDMVEDASSAAMDARYRFSPAHVVQQYVEVIARVLSSVRSEGGL